MRHLRRLGIALLLPLPLACSDGSGPEPVPTTIQLSRTAVTLEDGDTTRISATVLDQNGQPLETLPGGVSLTWTSSDPDRATVVDGLITATRPGSARITATAGSASASAEVTVEAVPTGLEPAGDSFREVVAGTAPSDSVAARVVDRHGGGVSGIWVAFEAGAGSGTVTLPAVLTDSSGVARTLWTLDTRAGTQELSARVDGLSGSPVTFRAVVLAGPPAQLAKAGGDEQTTPRQNALPEPLAVRVTDSFGNPVNGAAVTWTVTRGGGSISPAAPATDTAGVARATWILGEEGENAATASVAGAGSVTFTATATAEGGAAPSITGISPATLLPGGTAVITGGNFGPTAAQNRVTIAGVAAAVTQASATQLTVAVPARGALPCEPTRAVPVTVTVGERSAAQAHPLRTAIARSLGVGESVVVLDGEQVRCNEIDAAGGRYLISVFNTSSTRLTQSSFQLRGAAAGGPSTSRQPSFARFPAPRRRSAVSPFEGGEHARWLEANRDLAASLGRLDRRAPAGGARFSRGRSVPAVGDTLTFRIPNTSASNLCSTFTEVRARAVYSGDYAVVFEDVAAPLAGQADSLYRQVGEEYERDMHSVLLANFGDPLAVDEHTDANGRLYMLFSKVVEDDNENVAGFVFLGDFFGRDECASSNQAEIFYARAPTSPDAGYSSGTRAQWLRTMRPTIIHEVKHLTSYAERLAGDAEYLEESWLEESTARVSEELWAREVFGYRQRGNTGYAASIYCEVRPTFPECEGKPVVMVDHFDALTDFHRAAGALTPLGRTTSDDFSFYGSGWSLVRWAIDHSGTSESAFLKALTADGSRSGVANLEARAGMRFEQMLADWSLAGALDDRPGFTPARPELAFPSWDTRDIFAGLNEDFPDIFTSPFPVAPRNVSYGDFAVSVSTLRGGSATLFELSGAPAGAQVIELADAAGGPPPSSLRIAIVRVQ